MFTAKELILEKLVHVCFLHRQKPTKNLDGSRQYYTPIKIACLVSGNTRLDFQPNLESQGINFLVTILSDIEVKLGDRIEKAQDQFGNILFELGEIRRITPLINAIDGIQAYVLSVTIDEGA